jgi:hypothetical protein
MAKSRYAAKVGGQVLFLASIVDSAHVDYSPSLVSGTADRSMTFTSETFSHHKASSSHRQELQLLPEGMTDCEDYFGRTVLNSGPKIVNMYEHEENYFCVNGGFCKSTYKTQPESPCVCVEGKSMALQSQGQTIKGWGLRTNTPLS